MDKLFIYLAWINDPDVCISPRVREICDYAIRRVMEAEEEVRRLKIEIAVLTSTPTGKDIVAAYKQAEAENASLKEKLEQAEAALGEMREALEKGLYELESAHESAGERWARGDYTDTGLPAEDKSAMNDIRKFLQNPSAKAAAERWRAMERVVEAAIRCRDTDNDIPGHFMAYRELLNAASTYEKLVSAYEGVKGE